MSKNSINNSKSRYIQGGTTTILSNKLGWWERNVIEKAIDDIPVLIDSRYHLRPDLVASDYYNRSDFMWLVLQFNGILDINEEFIKNKTILIPSPTRVQLSLAVTQIGTGSRGN